MPRKTFDPESKTWKGADLPSIYNPTLNLGYIILSLFKNSPQQIHQINADTDARTSNYEMYWRVVRIAVHLRELGYRKGDTVAMLAGNSEYVGALTIAFLTLGMPISFIEPNFPTIVIGNLLGIVKPKLIFCDSNLMGRLKEALDQTKISAPIFTLLEKIAGHGFLEDFLVESNEEADFVPPNLGDISQLYAFIAFTTGTTGPQKGIVYTQAALIEMFAPHNDHCTAEPVVYLNFAPLYWLSGLHHFLMAALYGQIRVFTKHPTSCQLFIDIVEKYKVTLFVTAPYFVPLLLSHEGVKPLESIKDFACVGASISKTLTEKVGKLFPNGQIRELYGSTEAGINTLCYPENKIGAAGKVLKNFELKIIDENGAKLGPMERGEICVRFRSDCLGHYLYPDKDKATVSTAKDGFFHTGDIGYFDDDEFLHVVDRISDVLNVDMLKFSPSEIESVIDGMDFVAASSVVGVPDEVGFDVIYAFVKRKSEDLKEGDVVKYVQDRVPKYQRLRGGVIFVNEFPLSITGKILKRKLRERVLQLREAEQ